MKFRLFFLATLFLVSALNLVAEGGRCYYKLTSKRLTFNLARGECFEMGGDLVGKNIGPAGLQYHHEIRRISNAHGNIWIGYTDMYSEGVWRFLDGTPYNAGDRSLNAALYWHRGEPNNNKGRQHCGTIWKYGTGLDDDECGDWLYGLCEYPRGC